MILSGYSISQLQELAPPDVIRRADAFFVSRRPLPALAYESYVSESLPFGKFSDQLFYDLSAGYGFGSMIYELSSDYALAQHSHPYNFFDVGTPERYDASKHVVLATFTVDGRKVRIVADRPFVYEEPEPAVGELKFVANPQIGTTRININSPAFDGWVYPDGQIYFVQGYQFREAKALFGQDPGLNQLSVPYLSSFVKALPGQAENVVARPPEKPLLRHSHRDMMYFNSSKTLSASISVGINYAAGDEKDNGSMHLAQKPTAKGWPKDYLATVVLSASSASVQGGDVLLSEKDADVESYPSHNMMPVMIYIGKGGEGGEGDGGGDGYTKLFSADKTYSINVTTLTREIIDSAIGRT